jgi:CTP:molybdopterin cytidylyltransferase MocA
MSIAAAVLAAGRSERMGNPKALLDFRGRPFVVAVLEALAALDLKHRVVVLGPDAPRIRPLIAPHLCLLVENPDPDSGPIGSLRAALTALEPVRPTALLVWPVDIPHVRITTVERLIETHERLRAPVVVPVFGDRRGHPVIWDASLFPELATDSAAEREGARAILHRHGESVVHVAVDDPAVIDDIDTPQDYERLIREINRDSF